ncbi:MAG TPA: single-stranded-DNA-specific exonuclease RecJ [Anaerolineaceae bacterium]|jgi:single-stranded-DNA-specific exonuclease|nr:single-stranded-DNA-specific exonuclease RecJ [Anaerolineaceae bacterium]HPT24555.1 single-stranded-DNA-specific exonuclease RecJ [Anaerolineaceae bacterium]
METKPNTPSPKRWIISPLIPNSVKQELRDFSPLLRQLLYNRGIETSSEAESFLTYQTNFSANPLLLKDMPEAVRLIHEALQDGSMVAIYGDYDVDGVTASALLYEFFRSLGLTPRVYIPNRFDEGYGLNLDAMQQLAGEGIGLLITVDCGIRSVDEVREARARGMKVIVSDHHLPGSVLPPADAIINPRQPGDPYPYKHLAGVGLAYKIASAYLATYPTAGLDADHWLDLVAAGTVADLADLTGENRALVKRGLDEMRKVNRQGLFSLSQVAGVKLDRVTASNIGFILGPRLNAAGRLDTATAAFELLVSENLFEAAALAQQLDNQNAYRKELTQKIQEAAIAEALASDPDKLIIFAASKEFNEGVVGLAASRVVEALYKPAIIGYQDDGFVKASCRSIKEFNITAALDQCSDLLIRYGGHSVAAGLTVANENLPALLERLNNLAVASIGNLELVPELWIDYEISLAKVRPEHIPGIMDDVARLEPTGQKNPDVLFCSRNLQVISSRVLGNGQHLKMNLRAGDSVYEAIAFRQGQWQTTLPSTIDIAYTFDKNEYQGRTTLQLNVRDLKPSLGS